MKKMRLAIPFILLSVVLFLGGCSANTPPPKLLTPEQVTSLTKNIVNDICAAAPTATTIAITVENAVNSKPGVQNTTATVSKAVAVGCQTIQTSTTKGDNNQTTIVPVTNSTGTVVIPTDATAPSQ